MKAKETENTVDIPLKSIVVDRELEVRDEVYEKKVVQYARAYLNGDDFPPVLVGQRGNGFVLLDGFHRVEALKRIKATMVDARITSERESQWPWVAIKDNLLHGLNLKTKEVRKAFKVYMDTEQNMEGSSAYADGHDEFDCRLKSYRQIEADFGGRVNYTTIREWMMKDYPETARLMTDKNITPKRNRQVIDVTAKTLEKVEAALENAVALVKTLDDEEARGRAIAKAEEILKMMKGQRTWVVVAHEEDLNEDF